MTPDRARRSSRPTRKCGAAAWLAASNALLALAGAALDGICAAAPAPDVVTLSVVGTTDLHGNVFARDGRGGLALLGGYLANLRAARAADGGAVVLVDSGDTFQAGIESNLSEGAIVVDAYEALGYTAAVIGNHEFDFGPVDAALARQRLGTDSRGALKAAAARATFPFLAANLVDDATGRPVDWPNVHAAVLVDAAGVKVGIVGVMTIDALRATLTVNVQGLHVAPLAERVAAEATKLRAAGAQVVIVGAHAGGACGEFSKPTDLSSCDPTAEIFELARSLPQGLVDVIAAGHTHQGIAHEVAGIAIVQAYAQGRAFGRVDLAFDRRTQRVAGHEIFAPRDVCAEADPETLTCEPRAPSSGPLPRAGYEGRPVTPDPAVAAAMAPALERVRTLQATPLGVVLDAAIARSGDADSPLGNLFADAQRELSGADVAINNNVRGGLRADLPAGPLTLGRLYDAFPFDNRLVTLAISGAELGKVFADEVRRNRPGALGVSGVRVRARCSDDGSLAIEMFRLSGQPIGPDERVVVAAMDFLVRGAVFASVPSARDFVVHENAPVMREVVEDWLRRHGGHLDAAELVSDRPRWEYSAVDVGACVAP
jgi:5'-nucleotidase